MIRVRLMCSSTCDAEFQTQRVGGGNDFQHQFAHEFFPARIAEQYVGGKTG